MSVQLAREDDVGPRLDVRTGVNCHVPFVTYFGSAVGRFASRLIASAASFCRRMGKQTFNTDVSLILYNTLFLKKRASPSSSSRWKLTFYEESQEKTRGDGTSYLLLGKFQLDTGEFFYDESNQPLK